MNWEIFWQCVATVFFIIAIVQSIVLVTTGQHVSYRMPDAAFGKQPPSATIAPYAGDDAADFSLACPFLDRSPAYAHGVEFGMLWMRMQTGDEDEIGQYVTTANEEQVRVAASRLGWALVECQTWEMDGDGESGWVFMRLVKG